MTLPASGNSTTACGTYSAGRRRCRSARAASPSTASIRTAPGPTPRSAGRFYDAVVALPDNRYVVATHERPRRHRLGAALLRDRRRRARQRFSGRPRRASAPRPCTRSALLGDGSVLAAGESIDAAVSANRQMLVAKIGHHGRDGRIRRRRHRAHPRRRRHRQRPGDRGAGRRQHPRRRPANLAGKTAFALTRFTAAGARDDTFGNHGETVTPFGTPAVNGYITGMALSGNTLAVAGPADRRGRAGRRRRALLRDRRSAAPAAAARRLDARVDGITATSAHVTGSVNANGTASQLVARVRHDAPAYGAKTRPGGGLRRRPTTSTSASRHGAELRHALPRALRDRERHRHDAGRRRHLHDARQRRRRSGAGGRRQGRQEVLQGAQGRPARSSTRRAEGRSPRAARSRSSTRSRSGPRASCSSSRARPARS